MAGDDINDAMRNAKEVKPKGKGKLRVVASEAEAAAVPMEAPTDPWERDRGKYRDGSPHTDKTHWWQVIRPTLDFDADDMPKDCPVIALGKSEDDYHYYATASRRLLALLPEKHARNKYVSMFGGPTYLRLCWPRFDKNTENLTGFRPEGVGDMLMRKAELAGHWSPLERVRGVGAWRAPDGGIVFHCGNLLLADGKWQKPGVYSDFFYTRGRNAPLPAPDPSAGGEGGAGHQLLDLLRTWSWARGLDPTLLLGWLGAAMIGGWLPWRPFVWVTGDTSTGKSTLHVLIKALFGGASIAASDTSAAGIWQKVKHSSLPVQVDELEAKSDNRKVMAVVELARQASSGGVILRGGADHQGVEFQARSCFMFSSILIPPLPSQDLTRLAILELNPLREDAMMVVNEEEWRAWGDELRARMIAAVPRLPGVIAGYRGAMMRTGGHNQRGGDQFGTLLACAHVLLEDDAPTAHDMQGPAKELSVKALSDQNDVQSNAQAAVIHLVGWYDRDPSRKTIGELIEAAAQVEKQRVLGDSYDPRDQADPNSDRKKAADRLAQLGLRVDWRWNADTAKQEPHAVLVANRHPQLAAIFAGSAWQGAPEASGVWRQAFKRLDGADTHDNKTVVFAGVPSKCIRVPMRHFRPAEEQQQEAAE